MSHDSRDTSPLPPPPPPAPTPWPLWKAVLLSPFRPVGLLKRSDEVTVKGVLLIHGVGLLVGAVVFIEMSLWAQSSVGGRNFHPIWDVWNALRFDWRITVGGQGIIAFIDVALLVIGVVLSAWGARDETVRQSSKRSIKRAMLLLPHVVLLITLIVVPTIKLGRMEGVARSRMPALKQPPTYPANAAYGSPEQIAFEQERHAVMVANYSVRRAWRKTLPWYVQQREDIAVFLGGIGCVWVLWVLIVGFSHRPAAYRCRWPACCEQCGYSLMGLRDDQTCPECGHSVGLSRSWDTRPGTAWDRRHERGALRAWVDSLTTCLRPTLVGRQTRLLSADGSHHRLLLFALLLLAPIHVLFMWAFREQWSGDGAWRRFMLMWSACFMAGVCVLTIFVLGSAALVGRLASWRAGRNLLSIAAQGASHFSGTALLLWALCWVLSILSFVNHKAITAFSRVLGCSDDYVYMVLIGGPAVFGVLYFWIALWRYTLAARHANW